MHSRNEYIEKVKLQLDELNASLTQIEARAQTRRQSAGRF